VADDRWRRGFSKAERAKRDARIRERWELGDSFQQLAKDFDLTVTRIRQIVYERRW
jgi:Mor family transcriptional regulator